ncbi:MAG: DUF4956 domain-containing protein [Patescibacteria group bacterium]
MERFLFLAETEINAAIVVINLAFVLALELVIVWVYRRTHRTLSYSQSFVGTIILMGMIASLIMMVVTENIVGAFALLGAFALIRFRTIVKETRDIAFVFFALAVGVAVGTNNYTVAGIGTFFISAVILVMDRFNFASAARGGHILVLLTKDPFIPESPAPWHTYLISRHLLNAKTLHDSFAEYTFGVRLVDETTVGTLLTLLRKTPGVERAELMSGKDAVEY